MLDGWDDYSGMRTGSPRKRERGGHFGVCVKMLGMGRKGGASAPPNGKAKRYLIEFVRRVRGRVPDKSIGTGATPPFRECRRAGYQTVSFAVQRILLGCIFLCLAASLAAGPGSAPVVQARIVLAAEAAHPGSSLKAAVVAQVAPGFHINDHKPTLDYLIPTEVKFEPTKDLSVEKVVYPKGRPQKFAFSDTALSVYEGEVVVGALLKVAPAAPAGRYAMKGKLTYQACNDRACLPPTSVPLTLTLKVVTRGVPLKNSNSDVFDKIQFD